MDEFGLQSLRVCDKKGGGGGGVFNLYISGLNPYSLCPQHVCLHCFEVREVSRTCTGCQSNSALTLGSRDSCVVRALDLRSVDQGWEEWREKFTPGSTFSADSFFGICM